jgi:hypothetical protein
MKSLEEHLSYLEEGHAILEKWLKGTLYLKIDFDSKESYIVYYMVTQIFCFGCYSSWQRWRRLLLSCRMSPKGYTPCVLYTKGMSHKLFVSWNVTFFIAVVWSLWMNLGELLLQLMDLRLPGAAANICYHSKRNHCSHSPHLTSHLIPSLWRVCEDFNCLKFFPFRGSWHIILTLLSGCFTEQSFK